jgi:septum formation protein
MTYPELQRLSAFYQIVLGSSSPRRVELLKEIGIPFRQLIPTIDEFPFPNEHPYKFAQRLAIEKAQEIAEKCVDNEIVIGCDTVVVLGDKLMQKPIDEADAFRLLSDLSGHQHVVCSALALARNTGQVSSGYELTSVFFNHITAEQIRAYIRTREPMDKAGAYGIQGMGSFLVDRIEGNLDTVVGLPRTLLERLAREVLC